MALSQKNALLIKQQGFNGVPKPAIDCTEMVHTIGGIDSIDWELYLSSVITVSFTGKITDLCSQYGKTTFTTTSFPDELGNVLRAYLNRPRDERVYTVPVWVNRENELQVRCNTKKLIKAWAETKDLGDDDTATRIAGDELMNAAIKKKDVHVEAYLVPYQMDSLGDVKMGVYFQVIGVQLA